MASESYTSIPGPRRLPILGNGHRLWREPLAFPTRCVRQYGDVVRLRIPGYDVVLLGHPEHVVHVLDDAADRYRKGSFYREQLDIFESGLLVSEGALWRAQRDLLDPLFTPGQVQEYTSTIVDHIEAMVDGWSPGTPVRMESAMQHTALAIIADALCSVDIREDAPRMRDAIATVMDYRRHERRLPVTPPSWMPTPKQRRYQRALETFDTIVAEIIADHETATDPPPDVVTTLLDAREAGADHVTDEQIRDEILTLLLAGHDTTALAAGFMVHALAARPKLQARARTEVREVIGENQFHAGAVADLSLCRRIIDETLRLYSPVYHFAREAEQADTIDGYRIPPGTVILLHPWTYHRDPRWFDDPERFDPDRWKGDRTEQKRNAFIPFGAGPRRCLGERFARLELLAILATSLRRFRFETTTPQDPELAPSLSLRPAEPLRVIPAMG